MSTRPPPEDNRFATCGPVECSQPSANGTAAADSPPERRTPGGACALTLRFAVEPAGIEPALSAWEIGCVSCDLACALSVAASGAARLQAPRAPVLAHTLPQLGRHRPRSRTRRHLTRGVG